MQVTNNMVLFLSCYSFILPPKNMTLLAEEVQCKGWGTLKPNLTSLWHHIFLGVMMTK